MAIGKKEAKEVTKALGDTKQYRSTTGKNQKDFWGQYGVTQSGGSRYESGRDTNKPLKALMALHISGVVDDETLADAMRLASE